MRYGRKPIIGIGNIWRRCGRMIISTLILLSSSFAGCGTKPALNIPGPDGRFCLVGFVDSTEASIFRAKNSSIKAGDVLITPSCAEQIGIDVRNEIYELTR